MQGVPPPSSAPSVPKGRGRRVSAPGSEEQQAALLAAALSVQFSDSDLSFSDDSDSGEGDAADKSKSTSNSSNGAQVSCGNPSCETEASCFQSWDTSRVFNKPAFDYMDYVRRT